MVVTRGFVWGAGGEKSGVRKVALVTRARLGVTLVSSLVASRMQGEPWSELLAPGNGLDGISEKL